MQDVFDKSGPERLVAGGTWFLVLMILSGVFSWLSSVLVTRVYGPVGFGIFNTAYSLHNFAWVFIFGGLYQGLMKFGSEYVTKRSRKTKEFFSSALKYMTLIGVGMFVLLTYISLQFTDPIMRIITLSLGVSFLFSGTKDALASIIGSFQQSNYLSIIGSSRNIIMTLAGVAFILVNAPSYMLPSMLIIGTVGQLILCIHFFRKDISNRSPFKSDNIELFDEGKEPELQTIIRFKKVAQFGFFISLAMIAFNIMKSLDIVVLTRFFDYADVGIYSVADIASSILFYMTSFSLPVIPAIAEAHARKSNKLMKNYVKIAIKYPLIIGVPLTIIIFIMAEPLILYVYGADFVAAIAPLQILIIGTFLLMFAYNLSSILIGIGKSRLAGILMSVAAIQYIGSLFILVPMFGFNGAALALTLTGVTSMFFVPYYLKKELGVSIYKGLHMVVVSAVIMFFVLQSVPKTNALIVLVGVVGSAAIFVASLYLMGYITKNDLKMMQIAGSSFAYADPKRKSRTTKSRKAKQKPKTNKRRVKRRIKISRRKPVTKK